MKYVNTETGEILHLAEFRRLQARITKQHKTKRRWSKTEQRAFTHLAWLVSGLTLTLIVVQVAWR